MMKSHLDSIGRWDWGLLDLGLMSKKAKCGSKFKVSPLSRKKVSYNLRLSREIWDKIFTLKSQYDLYTSQLATI